MLLFFFNKESLFWILVFFSRVFGCLNSYFIYIYIYIVFIIAKKLIFFKYDKLKNKQDLAR
jgi:hypothetical protein